MYDVSFKQKEKNQVGGVLAEGTLTLEARHHQKDICKQLNGVGKLSWVGYGLIFLCIKNILIS